MMKKTVITPEGQKEVMMTQAEIDDFRAQEELWLAKRAALEPDRLRKEALTERWPDAFALMDDLIADLKVAGFDNLPTIVERDAIKSENPKGK